MVAQPHRSHRHDSDRSALGDLASIDLSDISSLGLGRAASELLTLRRAIQRRESPGDRALVDRETLTLLDRVLAVIRHEADRRDRLADAGGWPR